MRVNLNYLWLLTLILVAGKAFGYLEISWFWALFPAILSVSFGLLVILILICVYIFKDK